MKRKLLTLSFLFSLMISVISISDANKVGADDAVPETARAASSLSDFTDANENYELTGNIYITSNFVLPDNVKINCADYSFIIQGNVNVTFGGNFYIISNHLDTNPNITVDSADAVLNIGEGTFSSNTANNPSFIVNSGTLNINGGSFIGGSYAVENLGTLNINGGSFKWGVYSVKNLGTLNISGGTFSDNSIYNSGRSAICTLNGGDFSSSSNLNSFITCEEGSQVNVNTVNFGEIFGKGHIALYGKSEANVKESAYTYFLDNASIFYNNATSVNDTIELRNSSSVCVSGNSVVNLNCTDTDETSSFSMSGTAYCSGNIDDMTIFLTGGTFTGNISTDKRMDMQGDSKVDGNITLTGSNLLCVYYNSVVTGDVTATSDARVNVSYQGKILGSLNVSDFELNDGCVIAHLPINRTKNGISSYSGFNEQYKITIDCEELSSDVLSGEEPLCFINNSNIPCNNITVNYRGKTYYTELDIIESDKKSKVYICYDDEFNITYNADMSYLNGDYSKSYTLESLPFRLPEPKIPANYSFTGWRVSAVDNPLNGKVIKSIPAGTTGDLTLIPVFTKIPKVNSVSYFGQNSNYSVTHGDSVSVSITDSSYTNYRITNIRYISANKTWIYTITANNILDNTVIVTDYAFTVS